LHVSRYIHLNPATSFEMSLDNLKNLNITSLPFYMNNIQNNMIKIEPILKLIGSPEKYWQFLENQLDYQRKLNKIKHLILD